MGLFDVLKDQFLDVIEFEDVSNKLIVYKFQKKSGNNEIKQGSKIIIRESQCGVFLKGGQLADIFGPGTYSLTTENFPILSTLKAFPFLFASPVIADLYFISTRQFIDNKWATKSPVIKRDAEMNMIRLKSFGKYGFRIVNVEKFMKEVFGTKGIVLTFDIVQYLSSMMTESFADVIGAVNMSILDLASHYRELSSEVLRTANKKALPMGIEFSDVIIESLTLPEEVEKMLDEQSGIGLAKQDMATFMQYNTTRAMRDAAQKKGGLAGLGAGMALGNQMVGTINQTMGSNEPTKSTAEKLREMKSLLDEGILTQEEFDAKKKQILGL